MAPQRIWSKFAVTGLVLAVVGINMAALAGIGTRMELWHFSTGFAVLKWAAIIAVAALALSLVGFYFTRVRRTRRGVVVALLGVLIAVTTMTPPLVWMARAAALPRIHDITTDTTNPPRFQAVLALRRDAPNATAYGGAAIAQLQQQAYPEVAPATFSQTPPQVFDAALTTATAMGWHIVAADREMGRIEATDTTFWFGFKDDVVIRITPEDGGARVDVRSVSRVGLSDVGTNAERVITFLNALRGRLGR